MLLIVRIRNTERQLPYKSCPKNHQRFLIMKKFKKNRLSNSTCPNLNMIKNRLKIKSNQKSSTGRPNLHRKAASWRVAPQSASFWTIIMAVMRVLWNGVCLSLWAGSLIRFNGWGRISGVGALLGSRDSGGGKRQLRKNTTQEFARSPATVALVLSQGAKFANKTDSPSLKSPVVKSYARKPSKTKKLKII